MRSGAPGRGSPGARPATIRTRLVLLVLAAVAPFTLLATHDAWVRLREKHDLLQARALNLARLIAARVDDHVSSLDALMVAAGKVVAADSTPASHREAVLAIIRACLPSEFEDLVVQRPADLHGPLPALTSGRVSPAAGLAVSEPARSPATGRYTVTLSLPVLDARERIVATLSATLMLDRLRQLLETEGLPGGSVVTLVDRNGIVVARSLDFEHWVGRDLSRHPYVHRAIETGEGVQEAVFADGVRRLSGHSRVPGVPWVAFVGIPSNAAFADERAAMRQGLLLGAVTLALALVLAGLLAGVLARPLRALTADAVALSAGDLSRRTPVRSPDELGQLAAAFNHMAAALERRTSELQERERLYRELFETNPLPMWVFDLETTRFLSVNDAAVRRYGWSREEFLAMKLADIRPAEDVPRLEAAVAASYGERSIAGVWRHLRKDGSIVDVEITSNAMTFAGRPARLVLAVDVTERLRNEAAMRRFTQELERRVADRTADLQAANRELETFSYSVSHDLRAPLRAIGGFARILREGHGAGLDAEGLRLLDVIGTNGARMSQLIDDLLAFARAARQEVHATTVDVDDLAREVFRELRAEEPERDVQLVLGALPAVRADRAMVRQVLVNLLDNALKFTRGRSPALVEVGARDEGTRVVYYVRDNGVGFDMRYVGRLFGAFQRLHASHEFEGTGVGLALVQRVVRRHGGEVWAEGKEDGGATFFFTLPRYQDAASRA